MMSLGFHLPTSHTLVRFSGDERQRKSAEAWCYENVRHGFYVKPDADEVIFHFKTKWDVINFRYQFHRLCSESIPSSEPFPLLNGVGDMKLN